MQDLDLVISIQSANRPESVEHMTKALTPIQATWFVPESQAKDYRKAGATVVPVAGNLPMKAKQLNAALEFAHDKILVTMDDDFIKAVGVIHSLGGKVKSHTVSLYNAICDLHYAVSRSDHYLCGVASNLNPFWTKKDPSRSGMILGQFMAHKPGVNGNHPLRFDEHLTQLEDLDYVIQHHIEHEGIHKINNLLMFFHMNNGKGKSKSGGYSGIRTKESQQETLRYIKSKYDGDPIQDYIIFDMDAEVGKGVTKKMRWKKIIGD